MNNILAAATGTDQSDEIALALSRHGPTGKSNKKKDIRVPLFELIAWKMNK